MIKTNAVIHIDANGNPVHPSKAASTKYMWFVIADGQVTDELGRPYLRNQLTEYFMASSPDSKKFRKQLYPFTNLDNTDQNYGTTKVYVEEWTCPVCSTHNRHVDDNPAPPAESSCRHCQTRLTQDDIQEWNGVCELEIDLNDFTSKVVKK